jgi:membrane protein YdbS with pleckstrin-like domain
MTLAIVPLTALEAGYVHVLRVRAGIRSALLLAVAVGAETAAWLHGNPLYGLIAAPAALLASWMVLIAPPRRWKHMGYAYTGRELHVAAGYLFRSLTIVPVSRVQHIDIVQGPIERHFGLATLILNTAGSDASAVLLPGIARTTAEDIRDSIRVQIGSATA